MTTDATNFLPSRTTFLPALALVAAAAAMAMPAQAQSTTAAAATTRSVVYPAKGQTAAQQDKDHYECHTWARTQSGYDPTQAPAAAALEPVGVPTTTPATAAPRPSMTSGMVNGALGGAAVAELTHHNAGRGAAIGVVGGTLLQQVNQQKAAQAQATQQQAQQQAVAHMQAAQQQAAARQQSLNTYERAMGACMEGRGYTVK